MLYQRQLFLLLLIGLGNVYTQSEGNICKHRNGVDYRCTKIQQCKLNFKTNEIPRFCGFNFPRGEPLFCCKTDSTSLLKPPTIVPFGYQRHKPKPIKHTKPLKSISKQKCYEYTKIAKRVKCGHTEKPLILNGEPASPREFPHQASIGYASDSSTSEILWLCTGSLISENFVMSAGHCSTSDIGEPKYALLGDLNLTSETDDAKPELYKIVEIINHPKYSYGQHYNDIALYRLEKNVEFDAYKLPACLNPSHNVKVKHVIASGWGQVSSEGPSSPQLLKVALDLVPGDICKQDYSESEGLPRGLNNKQMICAGDPEGKKDTCQGDSGGPLQVHLKDPYCMYSIIGVTSFGKLCGLGVPGVYTRVSYYIPWIEDVVWRNQKSSG